MLSSPPLLRPTSPILTQHGVCSSVLDAFPVLWLSTSGLLSQRHPGSPWILKGTSNKLPPTLKPSWLEEVAGRKKVSISASMLPKQPGVILFVTSASGRMVKYCSELLILGSLSVRVPSFSIGEDKILTPCCLDIAFYGLGLNSSIILQTIGFGTPVTKGTRGVYDNLANVCVGNLILAVAGLIPGYWATFLFVDTWGRRPIQLMGFILLTILFIIMGMCGVRG